MKSIRDQITPEMMNALLSHVAWNAQNEEEAELITILLRFDDLKEKADLGTLIDKLTFRLDYPGFSVEHSLKALGVGLDEARARPRGLGF